MPSKKPTLKKPISKKSSSKLDAIDKTHNILKTLEKKYPKQLFSNDLTIGNINLLTLKFRKEPEFFNKVKSSIKDKKFNFKKLIESLKREQEHTNKLNIEQRIKQSMLLTDVEKKSFSNYLIKNKIKPEFAEKTVDLLSNNYTKKEIREIVVSFSKVFNFLHPSQRDRFYRKTFYELKKTNNNYIQIITRLASNKISEKQRNYFFKTLFPNYKK